jgi:hypothetical protein
MVIVILMSNISLFSIKNALKSQLFKAFFDENTEGGKFNSAKE